MLPRERVIAVIRREKPDRVPIYAWLFANLAPQIEQAFGSLAALEDHYEFDFAHLFGGPGPYPSQRIETLRAELGGEIEPGALLDVPLTDPNCLDDYQDIAGAVRHHKTERGRFVYVQTPGIFECLNGVFGIENHLAYLLLFPDELHAVYRRQAEWNRAFAHNCLDLGVDMVHVSDDWGAQKGLMFSPKVWWDMMYPYHKIIVDGVKARGAFVSLHSDGNVTPVLDGIVQLGYDVVHPYQESAGMDLALYKQKYRRSFTMMGGLDIQTTIGFGKLDFLRAEIERVLRVFADGSGLYCTSHFVQDHCTIDELVFALDTIYDLSRAVCRA